MAVPYQLPRAGGRRRDQLSAVVVEDLDGGQAASLAADALLPFLGLSMELGPIRRMGPSSMESPKNGSSASAARHALAAVEGP